MWPFDKGPDLARGVVLRRDCPPRVLDYVILNNLNNHGVVYHVNRLCGHRAEDWRGATGNTLYASPPSSPMAEAKGILGTDLGVTRLYDVLKTFAVVYVLVMLCFTLLVR